MHRTAAEASGRLSPLVLLIGIALAGPPADAADALGDARLFFAPDERRPRDRVPSVRGPVELDRRGGESGERAPIGRDANGRAPDPSAVDVRVVARTSATAALDGDRENPRVGFEALMRVGRRIRVIVDGRPCRGVVDVPRLRCETLPDGVRALALAADGRRLVVTLRDGRRRHLAVGGTLRP